MINVIGDIMAQYKIAVDAGHGGSDYGATYNGRAEKDDNLKLALAVGDILEKNGIDVVYTRTTDEYETPFKKATDANDAKADYFVSIHRNSSPTPNQYTGVETLVYNNSGIKSQMAANINSELEKAGFKNLGITERPNLVVLKRTKMPAVLVEAALLITIKIMKHLIRTLTRLQMESQMVFLRPLELNQRQIILLHRLLQVKSHQ